MKNKVYDIVDVSRIREIRIVFPSRLVMVVKPTVSENEKFLKYNDHNLLEPFINIIRRIKDIFCRKKNEELNIRKKRGIKVHRGMKLIQ